MQAGQSWILRKWNREHGDDSSEPGEFHELGGGEHTDTMRYRGVPEALWPDLMR